ncbi:MAG: chemotaxis response regulator protein-glutamate methylesterase [Methylococcales bacterium]|nr:chemotaxis response regulator protein-glutamate methylesterase [Methylococcales bacterium]MDD5754732.1 chemotaxis response regulator protein-glutamate methylesterase [Methylococcales bacterium]
MSNKKPIRVLIIDDSALVRRILSGHIGKDSEIEIVGQAENPYEARDLMVELQPDVITLDLEMPRMDGLTFLKHFMAVMPTPTIIVSSLTQEGKRITLDALEAGAVDVIAKPTFGLIDRLPSSMNDINERIKMAATVNVKKIIRHDMLIPEASYSASRQIDVKHERLIAIGSSTGGVEALTRIMPMFPSDSPSILIVQHMPAGFTDTFARRLDNLCKIHVKEAEDGEVITRGVALIAPGGQYHTRIIRSGNQYRIILQEGDLVNYSRPAVDVLFYSVAREAKHNVSAAILTGMGKDGAAGMLAIRQAGGRTYAQDEATSVVFGMPQVANDLGAVEKMLPLEKIPSALLNAFNK